MKPRNQYERNIVALSEKLPALTTAQRQWAIDNCFGPDGYKSKNTVWCLHCGNVNTIKDSHLVTVVAGCTCQKCGRELKNIEVSRRKKVKESDYLTIVTTIGGFQVVRHFLVSKYMHKLPNAVDAQAPAYSFNEAVQTWIDSNGKNSIIARSRVPSFYVDQWNFNSPLSLKKFGDSVYNFNGCLYPRQKVLPIIRRNGYNGHTADVPVSELFSLLLRSNRAETLYKTGQHALLRRLYSVGLSASDYASAKICIRNNYIVEDAGMWIDYLDLLQYFHKDTRNAHYVCPANLQAEHDRLMNRKRKIEREKRKREDALQRQADEEMYSKHKSRFFGICFGDDDILISVITSVADMYAEGEAMHHCVYTNGYYKKPDSLILSARDRITDHRIETIEVNLKTLSVEQSRGVCNENTIHHGRIIELVNNNIHLIKKAI